MAAAEAASGFEFPYLWAFVAFGFVLHCFEMYLEHRQLSRNREGVLPEELASVIEEKLYKESQVYQYDKRTFSIFREWVNFPFQQVMLIWGNPFVWHWVVKTVGPDAEYKATLLWLLVLHWIDKPLELGFSYWSNFSIEAKHGFNKMTMKTFVTDIIKSEALTMLFGGILIPLIIWIVHWGGESAYLYLWAFVQVLIFAFMWIYPNFIQPLFNKFETLKDEVLKEKIEALCAGVSFPLTKLFQIDGSTRSSHSNAYFFGFWKNKRIVLYDTLLHLEHDNILAILCHELGHWKFGHVMMNLCISSVHIFTIFWFFGVVMYSAHAPSINDSFGYGRDNKAVIIGLMNFTSLLSPLESVIRLGMTILSRANEFQADRFAAEKGRSKELKLGLLQIHKENKGELNPDEWYSWYHYSHPPLLERLRAMDAAPEGKKDQ